MSLCLLQIPVDGKVVCYKCTYCDKLYTSRSSRDRHVKVIHLQAKVQCGLCHTQLNYKHNLNHHLALHNPSTDAKCNLCALSFLKRKDLDRHQVDCHPHNWSNFSFTGKNSPLTSFSSCVLCIFKTLKYIGTNFVSNRLIYLACIIWFYVWLCRHENGIINL